MICVLDCSGNPESGRCGVSPFPIGERSLAEEALAAIRGAGVPTSRATRGKSAEKPQFSLEFCMLNLAAP